ncbi:MAG: non-canonical purine NTP pyrophosphatase [Phycisphaeraceae bacterium]
MRILLATSNPHKRDEILAILEACGAHGRIELVTLEESGAAVEEPVEDGATFEANALIKARHYAQATGELCLADDSGLEVDALGGEPGVRSARYSGVDGERAAVDLANNRLLLEKLSETPAARRTARFVCAMVLCAPPDDKLSAWINRLIVMQHVVAPDADGRVLAQVRGTVEGRIITTDEADDPRHPERGRGRNGFGYDPLFMLPERGCTSAELSTNEKNAISHRGKAARQLWARLQPMLDEPAI